MRLKLILLLILFHVCQHSSRGAMVRVGTLFQDVRQYSYDIFREAVKLALEDVTKDMEIFGIEFESVFKYYGDDTALFSKMIEKSVGKMSELVKPGPEKASMVVGPGLSEACVQASLLATYANIPMISYGCSAAELSNKLLYPTFIRTNPFARVNPNALSYFMANSFKLLGWGTIGMVNDLDKQWGAAKLDFQIKLPEGGINIDPILYHHEKANKEELMKDLTSKCRVALFLCPSSTVRSLLEIAERGGFYTEEYAFVTVDLDTSLFADNKRLLRGVLDITVQTFINDTFKGRILQRIPVPSSEPTSTFFTAALIYDAVTAYGKALAAVLHKAFGAYERSFLETTTIGKFLAVNNMTLLELDAISRNDTAYANKTSFNNNSWKFPENWAQELRKVPVFTLEDLKSGFDAGVVVADGVSIARQMLNLTILEGASGHVHLDSNGSRHPIITLRNYVDKQGSYEDGVTFETFEQIFDASALEARRHFVWLDGVRHSPPKDEPPCGFDDPHCHGLSKKLNRSVFLGTLIPFGLIFLAVIAYAIYKKQSYENDLWNTQQIIHFSQLEMPTPRKLDPVELATQEDLLTSNEVDNAVSVITTTSYRTNAAAKRSLNEMMRAELKKIGIVNRATGAITFVAKYKGAQVFVKVIPKEFVFQSRDILVEIKNARDLAHVNINPYVCYSFDTNRVALASSFCTKGSLQDVLLNEDIQLDWTFRHTFCIDIASGLQAIHDSPVKVHGHLTSKNVLIDNRWVCKIADYGLFKFKETHDAPKDDLDDEERYKALLWIAPENIALGAPPKSKAGDVYSFGIVMSEIISRITPFSTYSQYTAREIIHFVHKRCIPPFRPHVRLQAGLDGRLLDLMRNCWNEFPDERPSIAQVRSTLKHITKGGNDSGFLVDNMIDMMEKYSQGLEKIVAERTDQLLKKQEKVERVIHQSLPPSVALKLRNGKQGKAKLFTEASVLSFEVADFNWFIERYSPQQIIDLVHDIHAIIDSNIKEENVFKAKVDRHYHTLICGLPEKEAKHAQVLAVIALKIMSALTTKRFRHVDDEQVKFKIALHTGPVVGSLVGAKSPRYKAFGETIEYANFLSYSTPPLRIMLSTKFKEKLDASMGYKVEPTGGMLIKGHGVLNLFYLVGRVGATYRLRNITKNTSRKMSGQLSIVT